MESKVSSDITIFSFKIEKYQSEPNYNLGSQWKSRWQQDFINTKCHLETEWWNICHLETDGSSSIDIKKWTAQTWNFIRKTTIQDRSLLSQCSSFLYTLWTFFSRIDNLVCRVLRMIAIYFFCDTLFICIFLMKTTNSSPNSIYRLFATQPKLEIFR
jgi:hypothetical protein